MTTVQSIHCYWRRVLQRGLIVISLTVFLLAPLGLSVASPSAGYLPEILSQSRPPDQTLVGEREGSLFGYAVAGVGDVNGDGYADVIVGAPQYDPGGRGFWGKVYLYYGGPQGLALTAAFTDLGSSFSQMGYAVAGAGDVNGDGYADVVVGAPYAWYTDPNDAVGRVRLYLGRPDGLTPQSDFNVYGLSDSCLGWAVAGPGDLNGDGFDDVIVGDICHDNNTGRVLVYHGSSGGLSHIPATILPGHQEYAFFGFATAGAGDVNGDGYPDVIIGERGYELSGSTREGRAYIYQGGPGGLGAPADSIFTGQRNDALGNAVAGGDLNGDAYNDVLVGARYEWALGGSVYGYAGGAGGAHSTPVFSATRAGGGFGMSVALPGDLTGNGYSDAVVGVYTAGDSTGAVALYAGSALGLSATPALTLTGEKPNDRFGYTVAAAGDINGDGHPDLLVGAPYYREGESYGFGKVYVYFGGALTGLSVDKRVIPVYAQPGQPVTYTIVLRNYEMAAASGLALTDTLPLGVTFAQWDERPAGTVISGSQITWQGTLTAHTTLTVTFGVTHTLHYGQVATNVVSYTQGARQGYSTATFYVWRQVYLPLVVKP